MSDPWFNENLYSWIPGTALGILAGLWGCLAGMLVPYGRARSLILGGMWVILFASAVLLSLGLIALLSGQPYDVWYGLGLAGAIGLVVIGVNTPNVYRLYRTAEERKLAAHDLKDGDSDGVNPRLGESRLRAD
jgi:multidrug transporter EmrE-like cation transporter